MDIIAIKCAHIKPMIPITIILFLPYKSDRMPSIGIPSKLARNNIDKVILYNSSLGKYWVLYNKPSLLSKNKEGRMGKIKP